MVVEDYVTKVPGREEAKPHLEGNQAAAAGERTKWVDRPTADIARRDIHDLLDRIMAEGKGYSANRTYAALKTFFRWCASRDLIPTDPMQGVERPFDGETGRERAWSDDEVAGIWRAADTIGGSAGAALKVLLLMGQRRDEVSHMQVSELEADATRWRLTTARSKAKREHVFPLPALAQRLVRRQLIHAQSVYVFPTSGGEPIVNWAALKKRIRRLSKVEDFTFHCAATHYGLLLIASGYRRTLRTNA